MRTIVAVLALAACAKSANPSCKPKTNFQVLRVDENSELMRKIFTHAGPDHSTAPRDPAAVEAKIVADVDVWKDEQGHTHSDYFLRGPDRASLEKYLAALPAELKPPADHAISFQNTDSAWRTYYVTTKSEVDPAHIVSAHLLVKDETHGIETHGIALSFDDQGKAAFTQTTTAALGHKLATVIDGEVLNAPVIGGVISGGTIWVTTPTDAEAAALLKKIGC
ncbi:MAG: hypothetical protein QM831_19995 [Kofleriaceae bacterium]